jgi:erythronate-4-phosphate dehydrogenase
MNMKILADANIPYVEEAFGNLGQVELVPGRLIGPTQVRDADVLLVRSVTPVNADLLAGSRVRFVGSATIGVDHVDLAYLQERHIAFAYAPGSNANSVAEYVVAAVLALPESSRARGALGIIGLGRIGRLVQRKAEALGMTVLANDPPLERAGRAGLVTLDKLLTESDIVSCHVPLTTTGLDATFHLLNETHLAVMRPHAVVVNTARGPVVDNAALLLALRQGRIGGAVLDVWEGEPALQSELIRAVSLGTPHIAGYSADGKLKGTQMLYEAACALLERPLQWRTPALGGSDSPVPVDPSRPLEDLVKTLVVRAYDIRLDDTALRAIADLPLQQREEAFDHLRATYRVRLEFKNTKVIVPGDCPAIGDTLGGLGFTVSLHL